MRTKCTFIAALLTTIAVAQAAPANQLDISFQTVKIADGIHAFITPTGGSFVNGNSVLVVGKERALVVDSAHFPSMTHAMIAEVGKATTVPVSFLVNTHWHADHISGNSVYRESFPAVAIVSTTATRDKEASYPEEFDDVKQVEGFLPQIHKSLADNKGQSGKPLSPESRAYLENLAAQCSAVLPEFRSIRRIPPNVTFKDALTLDLGGRVVEVSFLGRGNTAGDAVIYVPDAKVLITGDLVVSPIPYAFGSYISEWAVTLEKLQAFDAEVIVPGHGSPQRNKSYIQKVALLLKDLQQKVNASVSRGLTDEQITKSLDLGNPVEEFTHGDKKLKAEFNEFFLTPATQRAIQEARKGKEAL